MRYTIFTIMSRIITLIVTCVLWAIFVEIAAKNDPVIVKASKADLEEQLGNSLREVSKDFEKAAKCLKERIQNGVPKSNIPRLDPFKFPIIPLILNNKLVKSNMWLTLVKLEGLSEFNLIDGELIGKPFPRQFHMRLQVDSITFRTRYNGWMKLFDMLKIFGKGKAMITLKNFELEMKIKLKVSIWTMRMKLTGLDLTIKLPSTEAIITGLLNDERMSGLISEQLTDVINTFRKEQLDNFSKFANDTLWSILDNDVNPILKNINVLKIQGIMEENIKILCGEGSELPDKYFHKFQTKIEDYLNVTLQGYL